MVDALNARFRDGVPNSDPNLAGVLLHQFDGQEDYDQGWRPCHQHSTNRWCATYADRFASSIINRQAPYVFNDHGGMIFNTIPDDGVALNRILCAYNADAGSMSVTCADGAAAVHEEGGCLPGCLSNWCTLERPWQCAWRPEELGTMMEQHLIGNSREADQHYNEVIVDTVTYDAHLPRSLFAIFFLDGSSSEAQQHAREVHARYHQAYPYLTDDDMPLLRLTLGNLDQPFERVSS